MNFATQAAMMGGNVRVGLEDSLFIGKGKLATSNAEQVLKIRRIVKELGFEIAPPPKRVKRSVSRAAWPGFLLALIAGSALPHLPGAPSDGCLSYIQIVILPIYEI